MSMVSTNNKIKDTGTHEDYHHDDYHEAYRIQTFDPTVALESIIVHSQPITNISDITNVVGCTCQTITDTKQL